MNYLSPTKITILPFVDADSVQPSRLFPETLDLLSSRILRLFGSYLCATEVADSVMQIFFEKTFDKYRLN
jgi:hypothetical protein